MAPTATSPVLGDKGANGAPPAPQSNQGGVALLTAKLGGLGNAVVNAGHGVAGAAASLVKQPALNSKDVMKKESEFGAHK